MMPSLLSLPRFALVLAFLAQSVVSWTSPCDQEDFRKLPFCNPSLSVQKRAEDLVSRISYEDKLGLLLNGAAAAPSVGMEAYQWWSEALHGVGISPAVVFEDPTPCATSFPQVQTTSMSFNKTLFSLLATAISIEGRAMNNVGHAGLTFWTPNVNIYRDPRWGRGQETPGEDPTLNSVYAAEFVQAFQFGKEDPKRMRASACCKHFEAYSFEELGDMTRHEFNAEVTKRDEADTYRPAFESCVRNGKVSGIMCSYNEVNGVPSCASHGLMTDLLRNEWGFEGYITSDCGAVEDVYDRHNFTDTPDATLNVTFSSGMDSDCGGFATVEALNSSITNGVLSKETFNRALVNLAKVQMRLGMFDSAESQPYKKYSVKDIATPEHIQLALEAARQGVTLLKNEGSELPWEASGDAKIAVIGPHANDTKVMIGNYIGVPPYITSMCQALSKYGSVNCKPGCMDGAKCEDTSGFKDAMTAVSEADFAVFAIGIDQDIEAEGLDRSNIKLPQGQIELIYKAAAIAANSNTKLAVVVLSGGSVDVSFIKENENIPAMFWIGYPGMTGGQAISEALFGDLNPSGRLTQTIYPQKFADEVSLLDMRMRPDRDSKFPGRTYRFYTGEPVYEFGYGLSYTKYNYTVNGEIPKFVKFDKVKEMLGASPQSSSLEVFSFNVDVTNLGSMHGSETVLAMIVPPNAGINGAPLKTLADFGKVWVAAGETASLRLSISAHDLSLANLSGDFEAIRGDWTIQVGNIRVTTWVV
mmetsp:Transcript_23542/g.35225  ORF Transcript_23542/g.35225 Transcript_23542/m.35225 type:complete len:755 (+) Transcript_23542:77-2341(+)